ncbi:hypothetical protein EMIT0111MI5_70027 [Burkholderia sp. IT-111MI5]
MSAARLVSTADLTHHGSSKLPVGNHPVHRQRHARSEVIWLPSGSAEYAI